MYVEKYGLDGIQTLFRGTLRGEGFCAGWDALVQLGCVRDDVSMTWPSGCSWADWLRSFVPAQWAEEGLESAVRRVTQCSEETVNRLNWLGLFDDQSGPQITKGTPAQIIQSLLEVKWELKPQDRDMIVMWHRFDYEINGIRKARTSSLSLEGKDSVFTAMSDTVGLPMALAVKPVMAGTFGTTGVDVPMSKTYYEPLLKGLADLGIRFVETELTR